MNSDFKEHLDIDEFMRFMEYQAKGWTVDCSPTFMDRLRCAVDTLSRGEHVLLTRRVGGKIHGVAHLESIVHDAVTISFLAHPT